MYIVLREDLASSWPRGALVAQACHASTAVTAMVLQQPEVYAAAVPYFSPQAVDSMRKVVVGTSDEASLRKIATDLESASVPHKLWIEQPENVATCIATVPLVKSFARKLECLRKLKLLA